MDLSVRGSVVSRCHVYVIVVILHREWKGMRMIDFQIIYEIPMFVPVEIVDLNLAIRQS